LCHLRVTAFDQRTDDQRTAIFATMAVLVLPRIPITNNKARNYHTACLGLCYAAHPES
jgi:hypothetical protein